MCDDVTLLLFSFLYIFVHFLCIDTVSCVIKSSFTPSFLTTSVFISLETCVWVTVVSWGE